MENIKSSNKFDIAETDNFAKKINHRDYKNIYTKIHDFVYPQLRANPFFGTNIKKLKGEFENVYRYRIGDFRLFYVVQENEVIVIMIDIQKRKDAYK
jgi:mRNA interferase RelE/StbE